MKFNISIDNLRLKNRLNSLPHGILQLVVFTQESRFMRVKCFLWGLLWVCLAKQALAADCGELVRQGYDLLSKGSYSQAVTTLTNAVRTDPQNILARKYLAIAMHRAGMPGQAAQQMEVVVQKEPENVTNLVQLADMLRCNGAHARAIIYFKKGLTLSPGNGEAMCGLVKAYMGAGDNTTALSVCRSGLRNSRDPQTRKELTRLMQELGQNNGSKTNPDTRG